MISSISIESYLGNGGDKIDRDKIDRNLWASEEEC